MNLLLEPGEEPAVEVRRGGGSFVVACEHASNRLPQALEGLGLPADDLDRHIAWDPGAAELAKGLAAELDADLVLQRYSRLAVDCNRDPELAEAFCTLSEDTVVPGNLHLTRAEKARRVAALFVPFHTKIERLLDQRLAANRPTALVTVHSFTPVFRGVARPWHVGFISTDERGLTEAMVAGLRRDRMLVVGDNEPYSAKDHVDYTIRRHGRDRGITHVMIEVRNDLLKDESGRSEWVARLAATLGTYEVKASAA